MKYTMLMGFPRRGEMAPLLEAFLDENTVLGVEQDVIWLCDRNLQPCSGCRQCGDAEEYPGCVLEDDFESLFFSLHTSDVLVFVSPVSGGRCSAPLQTILERMERSCCRDLGDQKSAFAMKQAAAVLGCGNPGEDGTEQWEQELEQFCLKSDLDYLGSFCCSGLGGERPLLDEDTETDIRDFAHALCIMVAHSV